MITYSFVQLKDKINKKAFIGLLATYALAVFLLFILFYPVLSGQPVDKDFVAQFLRWFDTWVLVI